jgi:hypothetical protein
MRVEREFVIFAVLLVALAANPVWFFPHAEDSTYEYRAVEITDENRHRVVERHPEVLECLPVERQRACGFEVAAAHGGVPVNASGTQYAGSSEYEYVDFPTEYYRPTIVETDDDTRLTLENVSAAEIVADLAYPYADATEQARTVVREGEAVVYSSVPDRDRIVSREGRYYFLEPTHDAGQPLGGWVPRYRWMMWFGTVPLSFAAMWRWS